MFDQVRIINLVDRPDRRREMSEQLMLLGGMADNISFFDAHRPDGPASFPSVGARGCFESHLSVLKAARDAEAQTLLILEDDLDFARNGAQRFKAALDQLQHESWSFFYGAHILMPNARRGLVQISSEEPVMTASCVGFRGRAIDELVAFLEALMLRPAGSPDYGPMHVDGAYTVFRALNSSHLTFAAFPTLGRQRSSPSDITPSQMLLDRWSTTKRLAAILRRAYNRLRRFSV